MQTFMLIRTFNTQHSIQNADAIFRAQYILNILDIALTEKISAVNDYSIQVVGVYAFGFAIANWFHAVYFIPNAPSLTLGWICSLCHSFAWGLNEIGINSSSTNETKRRRRRTPPM